MNTQINKVNDKEFINSILVDHVISSQIIKDLDNDKSVSVINNKEFKSHFLSRSSFLTEQQVEKILKYFLINDYSVIRKEGEIITHDLSKMFNKLNKIDINFIKNQDIKIDLTKKLNIVKEWGVAGRYNFTPCAELDKVKDVNFICEKIIFNEIIRDINNIKQRFERLCFGESFLIKERLQGWISALKDRNINNKFANKIEFFKNIQNDSNKINKISESIVRKRHNDIANQYDTIMKKINLETNKILEENKIVLSDWKKLKSEKSDFDNFLCIDPDYNRIFIEAIYKPQDDKIRILDTDSSIYGKNQIMKNIDNFVNETLVSNNNNDLLIKANEILNYNSDQITKSRPRKM